MCVGLFGVVRIVSDMFMPFPFFAIALTSFGGRNTTNSIVFTK